MAQIRENQKEHLLQTKISQELRHMLGEDGGLDDFDDDYEDEDDE